MTQISKNHCASFAPTAEQFIKTSEGKRAMQEGVESAADELTKQEGPNGFSNEVSTWEAQPRNPNGSFTIREHNSPLNGNVDNVFVGVQGNKVVAAGTDIMHYNRDAWHKEVEIQGPVTKESLQQSIEDAVLDPAGREHDEKPYLTEKAIVGAWL